MKTHAIIPIFIPQLGCPHSCVFCNQRAITARTADVTEADVRNIAEEYLSTLDGVEEVEMSFFGGSFTGIPIEKQSAFLAVAKEYKDAGRISKIHLSTRPDYISRKILDNLKRFDTDVIELGVQSFDENVLKLSERGHSRQAVYDACSLIKEYGFTLGIQLMIGLPGDSYEACMDSVRRTIEIGPDIARIYPTVIISNTKLAEMYIEGSYTPFTTEESVHIAKDMYKALTDAGINVIRVGLKASALINDGDDSRVLGGSYHPAFRQLLEGEIARDKIEAEVKNRLADTPNGLIDMTVRSGSKMMSNAVGHKCCNKTYFAENYPEIKIRYVADNTLEDNQMIIE